MSSSSSFSSSSFPIRESQYAILPSSDLLDRLIFLAKQYPNFCTLTTTQEWFGLPRAGSEKDCQFDNLYYQFRGQSHGGSDNDTKGCNNYVLILQDKEAYPDDPDVQLLDNLNNFYNHNNSSGSSSGWKFVPDVFLSGSVHGNERVGPTSLLEMAELLLASAHCESLPRMNKKIQSTTEEWEQELANARSCRESLKVDHGIPSPLRQWLARLVSTRRTVIIPTANALGYSQNKREEGNIDPNRDFPFDIVQYHEAECMQTIAGRSINELWRSHLFQIGLTFHGGMEVIGYEWGAPTYLNYNAPDALAQEQIANAYSRYSNGFHGHAAYDYGTMNDKVYYVRGGMEDWAFAGSWDPDRVVQCTPTTYGGYSPDKTRYNNSTLRAFNMLIETSNKKEPSRDTLGSRHDPLISRNDGENGHVARNIRLALLAMDVVEPYVSIRGVEELVFEDDVVPTLNLKQDVSSYYDDAKMVWVPGSSGSSSGRRLMKKISWTVGGAMTIDSTEIVFGLWDDLPSQLMESTNGYYPSMETRTVLDNTKKFQIVQPSNIEGGGSSGRSRWHANGAYPAEPEGGDTYEQTYYFDPVFETNIDIGNISPGTTIAVFARAKVDKDWSTVPNNVGPSGMGATSHIVNARTNPLYFASNAGKEIHGREYGWWYSDPISLVVGDPSEADGWDINDPKSSGLTHFALSSNARGVVTAVHLNARFAGSSKGFGDTLSRPKPRGSGGGTKGARSSGASAALVLMLLVGIGIFIRLVRPRRRRHGFRQPVATSDEEGDDMFDSSSYQDNVENVELGDVDARSAKITQIGLTT